MEMEVVHSSITKRTDIEVSNSNITFGPGGDLMFSFVNNFLNLSQIPKLFDWELTQEHYAQGFELKKETKILL